MGVDWCMQIQLSILPQQPLAHPFVLTRPLVRVFQKFGDTLNLLGIALAIDRERRVDDDNAYG